VGGEVANDRRPGDDVQYDYDWIVVGSGFGASVAALRLGEKGYRVGVVECGCRYERQYGRRAAI
jgi:choline dehydrogenase-like flavoprotein